MFLIVAGLYLTTVELVSDNMPVRLVMPEGFPHNQPLIYNKNNFNQTDGEVQDFVERGFGNEMGHLWSKYDPISTNISDHFFE